MRGPASCLAGAMQRRETYGIWGGTDLNPATTRRTWRDREPDRTPGSQSGLPGHDCEPGPIPPARTRKAPAGERHQHPPRPRPVRHRAQRRRASPHVHHQRPQARRPRTAPRQRAHRRRHLAARHPRRGPAVRQLRRPVPVHLRRQEREDPRHDRGRDARRGHDHPLRAGHRARHARQGLQGRTVPDHDLLGRLSRDELRRRQPRQLAVRDRLHRRPGVPGHHHRPGHLRHPAARPARRHRIRLGLARTRHDPRRQARRPDRPLPAADRSSRRRKPPQGSGAWCSTPPRSPGRPRPAPPPPSTERASPKTTTTRPTTRPATAATRARHRVRHQEAGVPVPLPGPPAVRDPGGRRPGRRRARTPGRPAGRHRPDLHRRRAQAHRNAPSRGNLAIAAPEGGQ